MSLATRLAAILDPTSGDRAVQSAIDASRHQRASTDPVDFTPMHQSGFTHGIGNQPSHEDLLRESRGVFDMAQRAIANRISTLEWEVGTTSRKDGKMVFDPIEEHPAKLLIDKPHPNITSSMLFRLGAQWVTSVGESHWLKVGSGLGVPVELHPIPPTNIAPVWRGGVIAAYVLRDGSGQDRTIEPDCVIHFYWPDPERYWGPEGYLGPNGATADTLKFSGQHMREFYRNDAMPKAVVKMGEMPTPAAQRAIDDSWRQRYSTIRGTARGLPARIPADADLIEMAFQTGSEIVPLLEHYTNDQLMGMGVPRSILGQVVSGDRSSAEVNQWVFDRYTVTPIANLIQDALTDQLAVDFDPRLKFRYVPFVSADKAFNLMQEEQDLLTKVKSPNQVLEKRGEPTTSWGEFPVGTIAEQPYDGSGAFDDFPDDDPDALGDRKRSPASLTPELASRIDAELADVVFRRFLDKHADDPELASAEALVQRLVLGDPATVRQAAYRIDSARAEWERQIQREKKFVPLFTQLMRKIFKRQRDVVLKRLADAIPRGWIDTHPPFAKAIAARISADQLFSVAEWDEIFAPTEALRTTAFTEIIEATLGELGGVAEFSFTETQAEFLREQGGALIKNVNKTTRNLISQQLEQATLGGESVDQIAARIKGVFQTRNKHARTIARTEVLKSSQVAQTTAYEVSGVVEQKMWNTSLDDAVREEHIATEGQVVGLNESFTLGDGEQADAPGVGAGGAPLSAGNAINCRCFLTPVRLQ